MKMEKFNNDMSHPNSDVSRENDNDNSETESTRNMIAEMVSGEDPNETSLLNSIVEAVMRGDMNEVVALALSHRNSDSKDKGIVDQALAAALQNKLKCDQMKDMEKENNRKSKTEIFPEDDVTESKLDVPIDQQQTNLIYSTMMKSDEDNEIQCSYYIETSSVMESGKDNSFCPTVYQNIEIETNSEDPTNGNFPSYQNSASSFHKTDNINTLKPSHQSVQVQLPGIGNFLLQLPSNLKPGEPITLPISLPLGSSSQTQSGNPISINMSTGQIITNQLLSLYNPSSCINNMTMGKKMRAIAPKPSKPVYRQPLIAPKTDSPNVSSYNQDCASIINSTPLPAPSGPGRRKGTKGKKVGRKRGVQPKSRKDSSYASSTHSIDSQDTSQYNDSGGSIKQNCGNFINSRNTYQYNYYVNSDSSDYINQPHVVPHSYNELQSNTLIDASDSGEKDLLSLAWEISNADLGNNDDFNATYQLYDSNNMGSESFVSSEILDQFLQNIQKDDICSDLSRCSSSQINLDTRVSYATSFTALPPCSTVLPSVTTSNYLNNSSNNQSNLELSHCIEIAEVVNLNTEDMLSELVKDENSLLDKFVARYSHNSQQTKMLKYGNHDNAICYTENKIDFSEKDLDPNVKESNELSEIAKQIEKDCDGSVMNSSNMPRNYLSHNIYDYKKETDNLNKSNSGVTYPPPVSDNFSSQIASDRIYSTTSNAFGSTVLDVKNHYIMSVNMDTKLQNETTYYITNGSLKSKTLDDFGLLEFCSETGENQYSETDCLDDKRYLEPPILEDISDASPIPSDDESVDEDIDLGAFKLSTFNHHTLITNKIYQNMHGNMENFWNASKMNDLLTLLDTSQLEHPSFSSDKWYNYDNFVTISDSFTCLEMRNEEISGVKTLTISCNKDSGDLNSHDDIKEIIENSEPFIPKSLNIGKCSLSTELIQRRSAERYIKNSLNIARRGIKGSENTNSALESVKNRKIKGEAFSKMSNKNNVNNKNKRVSTKVDISKRKQNLTKKLADSGKIRKSIDFNDLNNFKESKNNNLGKHRKGERLSIRSIEKKSVIQTCINEFGTQLESLYPINGKSITETSGNVISGNKNVENCDLTNSETDKKIDLLETSNDLIMNTNSDTIYQARVKEDINNSVLELRKNEKEEDSNDESKVDNFKDTTKMDNCITKDNIESANTMINTESVNQLKNQEGAYDIQVGDLNCSKHWKSNDNLEEEKHSKNNENENSTNNNIDSTKLRENKRDKNNLCNTGKEIQNDNSLNDSNNDGLTSITTEPIKHRKSRRSSTNSLIDLSSCNYKDRQSRLRKPPSKLAIYQSLKFVENEFCAKNLNEIQSNKDLEVKKKVDKSLQSMHNSKMKHCTRSKGLISKSYDSFYETLEKMKRNQPTKLKESTNHLKNKNNYKLKSTKGKLEFIDLKNKEMTDSNKVIKNVNESHLDNTIHFKQDIPNENGIFKSNVCLRSKKLSAIPNVSKKYNLRKNSIDNHSMTKSISDAKSSRFQFKDELKSKPKKLKKYDTDNVESRIGVNKNIFETNETKQINTAENMELKNHFDILTESFFIAEQRDLSIENSCFDLHKASVNNVSLLSCSDVLQSDNDFSKKLFPVRKINRKLRLLSGLEFENRDNHCTILELENFENLLEYTLELQILEVTILSDILISGSDCKCSIINELETKLEYQAFDANDEDFDDVDSCDARLVIVENDEILHQTLVDNCKVINENKLSNLPSSKDDSTDPNADDISNDYSKENNSKEMTNIIDDIINDASQSQSLLSCKNTESLIIRTDFDDGNLLLTTPFDMSNKKEKNISGLENEFLKEDLNKTFCNISNECEKKNSDDMVVEDKTLHIQNNDDIESIAIINFENDSQFKDDEISLQDPCLNEEILLNDCDVINACDVLLEAENTISSLSRKIEITCKILKRIKENKVKFKIYRNRVRFVWRTQMNKEINYSVRLKKKFRLMKFEKMFDMKDNLMFIPKGLTEINLEPKDLTKICDSKENEYLEVTEVIPDNSLCTTVDSNNVETFSRSYGRFSLKIKFQKQDPLELQENKHSTKRRKKNSKKRKKLRHFLSSIIGNNDIDHNKSNSGYESVGEESSSDNRYCSTRKRKHSSTTICSIDSSNQENINQDDKPPKLTPESFVNDDDDDNELQKPIKIKLFKSTNDDCSKSEEMIFSLQKSNSKDVKEKSSAPKMLQVLKDQQFKPCRQAANLAKKKIFSTAKEDRRSQNATLTTIWNPRKVNNALNKLPTDFINRCNDRRRRPRGRPPKTNQLSLFSEKYMSNTGSLKLKIRLSKDFKNCNEDNMSLNGENSGRTSTNDSSILNSAVAGINGPPDALSLESNNFINGLTQQLDETIDYLEAKEAKVFFDPHQVEIEKIKNSYYSNKKNNSGTFEGLSQQGMYDNSSSELCDGKKNSLSANQEFSNFIDTESAASYNNLSDSYSCNNKISHVPKDLVNISESCYNNLSTNREPQDLSQSNQLYSFNNQISSLEKNQFELWQSSKSASEELLSTCRNGNGSWFSKHRSFSNPNSILYDSYTAPNNKETKSCVSQNQNAPFIICDNETSNSKPTESNLAKQSSSKEDRKSSNNSFESHSQPSPNQSRGALSTAQPQLNIHNWSDEANHNTSLNHTAAAWMSYAQQQAAAAAYIDPQMKAYYNLALSQSMLNNPYCGAYGNPAGNPENFYTSLHSQYLNNSKELMEKNHSSGIRNHNETMGTFMEAAQISSWEHFYSAAAMATYHNTSPGAMDDYTGRAGNMLQAHHMLTSGYPGSVLARDHFQIESNKPPIAHQNQSGTTSPMKPIPSPTPISSAQAYSHVQMPYSHFNGFF